MVINEIFRNWQSFQSCQQREFRGNCPRHHVCRKRPINCYYQCHGSATPVSHQCQRRQFAELSWESAKDFVIIKISKNTKKKPERTLRKSSLQVEKLTAMSTTSIRQLKLQRFQPMNLHAIHYVLMSFVYTVVRMWKKLTHIAVGIRSSTHLTPFVSQPELVNVHVELFTLTHATRRKWERVQIWCEDGSPNVSRKISSASNSTNELVVGCIEIKTNNSVCNLRVMCFCERARAEAHRWPKGHTYFMYKTQKRMCTNVQHKTSPTRAAEAENSHTTSSANRKHLRSAATQTSQMSAYPLNISNTMISRTMHC